MGNMSYCQFENTASDMQQCINTLEEYEWNVAEVIESASSEFEARAITRFVKLCLQVVENIDYDELEDADDANSADSDADL